MNATQVVALLVIAAQVAAFLWVIRNIVVGIRADKREVELAVQPAAINPDFFLEAWTPLQREALGINATEAWIAATQAELNRLEWRGLTTSPDAERQRRLEHEKLVARVLPSETVELRAWGNPEPVRIRRAYPDGEQVAAAARRQAFDDGPTVTGERIFG